MKRYICLGIGLATEQNNNQGFLTFTTFYSMLRRMQDQSNNSIIGRYNSTDQTQQALETKYVYHRVQASELFFFLFFYFMSDCLQFFFSLNVDYDVETI